MVWRLYNKNDGSYNSIYINEDRTLVAKVQKTCPSNTAHQDDDSDFDSPERSVRLWNQLNPDLEPKAYVSKLGITDCWICPFIEGEQASDEEIQATVVEIYNRTGRILIDAPGRKNILKRKSDGRIICVDIAQALELAKVEDNPLATIRVDNLYKSITSHDIWSQLAKKYNEKNGFLERSHKFFPKTTNTIEALIFIKLHRPDIINVSFLLQKPNLCEKLATAYRLEHKVLKSTPIERQGEIYTTLAAINADTQDSKAAETLLSTIVPETIKHLRTACIIRLSQYVQSRGSIDKYGIFKPNWVSRIFRNTYLTTLKINEAKYLIIKLAQAQSEDEIRELLSNQLNKAQSTKSRFSSGFKSGLMACLRIIDVATKDSANNLLQNSR